MLMTKAAYARRIGVSPSTITKWIAAGRITVEPNGRIDSEKADQMREMTESALPHHQARKAQFDELRAARASDNATEGATDAPQPSQPPQTETATPMPPVRPSKMDEAVAAEKILIRTKLAAMKEREAKAELANLEIDQRAGLLVERSEVEFVLSEYAEQIKSQLGRLADRLTSEILSVGMDRAAIHRIIDESSQEILHEISARLEASVNL